MLLLMAVGGGVYAQKQRKSAEEARQVADQQRQSAEEAKQVADQQRLVAVQQRNLAKLSVGAARRIAGPISGQLLRLADTTQTAINSTSPIEQANAYVEFAEYHRLANDPERAKDTLREAQGYIDEALRASPPGNATARFRVRLDELRGDIGHRDSRTFPSAERSSRAALASSDGVSGTDPVFALTRARLLRKLADPELQGGNLDQSARLLQEAQSVLDLYAGQPGVLHELAHVAILRGELSVRQGFPNRADKDFQKRRRCSATLQRRSRATLASLWILLSRYRNIVTCCVEAAAQMRSPPTTPH